jgi:hypothetical protein
LCCEALPRWSSAGRIAYLDVSMCDVYEVQIVNATAIFLSRLQVGGVMGNITIDAGEFPIFPSVGEIEPSLDRQANKVLPLCSRCNPVHTLLGQISFSHQGVQLP